MDLKVKLGPSPAIGDCYCRRKSDEPKVTCFNLDCPISQFHLACLSMESATKSWLCPHWRKLPKLRQGKHVTKTDKTEVNIVGGAALLETICICNRKPVSRGKLLKCHNDVVPVESSST